MPKIPMLGENELEPGPRRDLVGALQELHGAAGWPSTRSISEVRGDFPGTLSHERVREILSGKAMPRWATLETLVRALVSMRHLSSRNVELEVARFKSIWTAAEVGEYGATEQLVHPDPAEGVHGDGSNWVPSDIARMLMNPFYAIDINPSLALPHEPLISEEEWIAVNLQMIADIGPESFLRTLLHVLKGGYLAVPDSDSDEGQEPSLHADMDAAAADEYVVGRILHRLGTEVNILGRSIEKLRSRMSEGQDEVGSEIEELESDLDTLRDAMVASPETWGRMSHEAQRLVLLYLIDRITVDPPVSTAIEEQIEIRWRIPVPGGGADS
jgi:hypothetical protein